MNESRDGRRKLLEARMKPWKWIASENNPVGSLNKVIGGLQNVQWVDTFSSSLTSIGFHYGKRSLSVIVSYKESNAANTSGAWASGCSR